MKRTENQIINCFKALSILTRGSTMKDLAVRLDVSNRTAYRYLEVLQNIGFLFEQREDHTYKLVRSKVNNDMTISFTKQEMEFVMDQIPADSKYYKSIRDKFYIHSDILSLPNKVLAADFGRNIRMLDRAIQNKKRVILHGYSSAHSNQKEDYKIEPINLDDNYQRLFAYDLNVSELKQFRTERIESVAITEETQWFSDKYTDDIKMDCFGWMIEDTTWDIELEMSRGVFHMIKEENPGITKNTMELEGNRFLLTTTVADLRPVTSLVLRFPGEIKIIKPREIEEEAARRLQKLDFFGKYFKALS